MLGFICDRCGRSDPGQERRGRTEVLAPEMTAGWSLVSGLGPDKHLCHICTPAVKAFIETKVAPA